MSRTLSTAALASVNASSTGEVWLPLLKLEHSDWAEPVFLVRNTEAITHDGDEYSPFPFDVALPDEEAEQTTVVRWSAMNASNELVTLFRAVSGPIDGTLMIVLASSPDDIEIGPLSLQLRGFEYDAKTIRGSMVVEPILDAVFGARSMDNINAPGLF